MKANFDRLKRRLVCIIQRLRLHRKKALSLYPYPGKLQLWELKAECHGSAHVRAMT